MKYYYCISEMTAIDASNVTSFIDERIEKKGIEIIKLNFDDSNFSEFLEKSEIGKHFTEKDSYITVLGEDEYLYKLSLDGLEKIAKTPIWMAHSTDNGVVSIDSDDKFYQKLKEENANVKYTRPDKYGHKLASKFLRKERWTE